MSPRCKPQHQPQVTGMFMLMISPLFPSASLLPPEEEPVVVLLVSDRARSLQRSFSRKKPRKRRLEQSLYSKFQRSPTSYLFFPVILCRSYLNVLGIYTYYYDYVCIINPTKKGWTPEYFLLRFSVLLWEKLVNGLAFNLLI